THSPRSQLQWRRLHQPALFHRCSDERGEQWMRRERPRFELRMKLNSEKPRVVGVLDDPGQHAVRRNAREAHAMLLQAALVFGVHLVTVAMAFGNLAGAVDLGNPAATRKMRRIGAKPHSAAEVTTCPARL